MDRREQLLLVSCSLERQGAQLDEWLQQRASVQEAGKGMGAVDRDQVVIQIASVWRLRCKLAGEACRGEGSQLR